MHYVGILSGLRLHGDARGVISYTRGVSALEVGTRTDGVLAILANGSSKTLGWVRRRHDASWGADRNDLHSSSTMQSHPKRRLCPSERLLHDCSEIFETKSTWLGGRFPLPTVCLTVRRVHKARVASHSAPSRHDGERPGLSVVDTQGLLTGHCIPAVIFPVSWKRRMQYFSPAS
ncbi:hypothetical protein BV898_19499 [Hypsibius exemplaris]|uniref:Uncharacterized protein n=1 Tax=Hypsibius exemplaris TaxID=2072580 RepID=A0A9X6RPN7_HYPEX|nr:hypothetical protein BV898_19499 [Hypsibius exemplaris]